MAISVFDLFTIGIGPSSSHTVGPMRAARRFAETAGEEGLLERTARVRVELYGSLALTGKGHGTDRAVLIGLEGETPEEVDPDAMPARGGGSAPTSGSALLGRHEIPFDEKRRPDLQPQGAAAAPLERHALHGLRRRRAGALDERIYYSIGGGFVVNEGASGEDRLVADRTALPYPFRSGDDLLRLGEETGSRSGS